MISLTCDYHLGASDDATIHHATDILSSGTHVSSSQDPKVVKSFLAESHDRKLCMPLLPLYQKSWRAENQNFGDHFSRRICLYDVQKAIAPQKQAVCRFSDNVKFDAFCQTTFYGRRKMKCRGSTETRLPKV